jgi:hypothetical protein
MAAYNGEAIIGETLDSLAAQTMSDWELIVVDDCSRDDTIGYVAARGDPRIRVLASAQNGGPVIARNRAFALARGRYVAGLDQDDLCAPDRFARQIAYLDAQPDTALVATAALVLENGRLRPAPHAAVTTPALMEWLLHIENPIVWSSVMMRAGTARALDPFTRPELLYAEDFDLYHRLAPLGRIARIDAPLVTYRQHSGGLSKRFADTMRTSATRVLSERYAPILGGEAPSAAALIAEHVMAQAPVPDRDTLARLGATLIALQDAYLSEGEVARDDRRLIRWETARRWARIGRAGLRTGALGLGDAVAVRPDHLGLGYQGVEQLVWSRLIGGARAMGRHWRDRA